MPIEIYAIQAVIDRYFYSLDRRMPKLLRSCFSDDAIYRSSAGLLDLDGAAAIEARLGQGAANFASTSQIRGSQAVDVEGNSATADTFAIAYLLDSVKVGGQLTIRGIQYLDVLDRRGGVWLIVERRHHTLWQYEARAVTPMVV